MAGAGLGGVVALAAHAGEDRGVKYQAAIFFVLAALLTGVRERGETDGQ